MPAAICAFTSSRADEVSARPRRHRFGDVVNPGCAGARYFFFPAAFTKSSRIPFIVMFL